MYLYNRNMHYNKRFQSFCSTLPHRSPQLFSVSRYSDLCTHKLRRGLRTSCRYRRVHKFSAKRMRVRKKGGGTNGWDHKIGKSELFRARGTPTARTPELGKSLFIMGMQLNYVIFKIFFRLS